MLANLLTRPGIRQKLTSLTHLAQQAVTPVEKNHSYVELFSPFCDGLMIKLGHIPKSAAVKTSLSLRNEIQPTLNHMIIMHIVYLETGDGGAIWVTLNPETTGINCITMWDVLKMVDVIKFHAKDNWGYNEKDL